MIDLYNGIVKYKYARIPTLLFAVLLVWWAKLQFGESFSGEPYLFNWSYGLINLYGGAYGIALAYRKWGGLQSYIGKAIIFLSLGLLSQWIGLQIWTYYNLYLKVEVAYPSLADVGYFMLIPFYTIAGMYLARVAGAKFQLKKPEGIVVTVGISLSLFLLSMAIFVRNVGIDYSNILKTILDIAYPLGEIIPFGIAIFVLYLSNTMLGGRMRKRIIFLAIAFILQFVAEYSFLFAVSRDLYTNGGINDILYPFAYLFMTYAIILFEDYH